MSDLSPQIAPPTPQKESPASQGSPTPDFGSNAARQAGGPDTTPEDLAAMQGTAGNDAALAYLAGAEQRRSGLVADATPALEQLGMGTSDAVLGGGSGSEAIFDGGLDQIGEAARAMDHVQWVRQLLVFKLQGDLEPLLEQGVTRETADRAREVLQAAADDLRSDHDAMQDRWRQTWLDLHGEGVPEQYVSRPRDTPAPGEVVVSRAWRADPEMVAGWGPAVLTAGRWVEVSSIAMGVQGEIAAWAERQESRIQPLFDDLAHALEWSRGFEGLTTEMPFEDGVDDPWELVAWVDERRGFERQWLVDSLRAHGVHPAYLEAWELGTLRTAEEMGMEEALFQAHATDAGARAGGGYEHTIEDMILPKRRAEIEERAAKIKSELHANINIDEDVINDQLVGLNRYEVDLLKKKLAYGARTEDGGARIGYRLQGVIDVHMDETQQREAEAHMSGDKIDAVIRALEEGVDGWDDDERIQRLLQGLAKQTFTDEQGDKMTGLDALQRRLVEHPAAARRFEAVRAELESGHAWSSHETHEMVAAAGAGREGQMRAYAMREAVFGYGFDEKKFLDNLDEKSAEYFEIITGETPEEAVADQMFTKPGLRTRVAGLSEGDKGKARAGQLYGAFDGEYAIGNSIDDTTVLDTLLLDAATALDPKAAKAAQADVSADYEKHFDEALSTRLDKEYGPLPEDLSSLGPAENRQRNTRILMEEARLKGRAEPARRLYFGLHGPGTPKDALKQLEKLAGAGVEKAEEDYSTLFGLELRDDVRAVDGRDGLDLAVALFGNDPSPDEMRQIAFMVREFANDASIQVAGQIEVLESYYASITELTEETVYDPERGEYVTVPKQHYSRDEEALLAERFAGFKASAGAYFSARKAIVGVLTTAGSVAVSALATFVTGGAASPWLVSALSTAAGIGLKQATLGSELTTAEITRDALVGALTAGLQAGPISKRLADLEKALGRGARATMVKTLLETGTEQTLLEVLDAAGVAGDGEFNVDTLVANTIKKTIQAGMTHDVKALIAATIQGGTFDAIDASGKVLVREALADALRDVAGAGADRVAAALLGHNGGQLRVDFEAIGKDLLRTTGRSFLDQAVKMSFQDRLGWGDVVAWSKRNDVSDDLVLSIAAHLRKRGGNPADVAWEVAERTGLPVGRVKHILGRGAAEETYADLLAQGHTAVEAHAGTMLQHGASLAGDAQKRHEGRQRAERQASHDARVDEAAHAYDELRAQGLSDHEIQRRLADRYDAFVAGDAYHRIQEREAEARRVAEAPAAREAYAKLRAEGLGETEAFRQVARRYGTQAAGQAEKHFQVGARGDALKKAVDERATRTERIEAGLSPEPDRDAARVDEAVQRYLELTREGGFTPLEAQMELYLSYGATVASKASRQLRAEARARKVAAAEEEALRRGVARGEAKFLEERDAQERDQAAAEAAKRFVRGECTRREYDATADELRLSREEREELLLIHENAKVEASAAQGR